MATVPLISTIIPTYNRAKLLKRALDSVLSQDWPNQEVIVVDDGSTDNTAEVLAAYGDRIKLVKQENAGPSAARNVGIEMARGEWIAFMDSDDEWLPNKLTMQMRYALKHPRYAMIYCDMSEVVDGQLVYQSYLKNGNYSHVGQGQIYKNLLHEYFIFTPTVLVKKEVFLDVGYFDTSMRLAEDRELWLRIAYRWQIGFLDHVLVLRHRHSENLTANRYLYNIYHVELFEKIFKFNVKNNSDKEIMKIVKNQLRRRYIWAGTDFLNSGEKKLARKMVLCSLKFGVNFESATLIFLSIFPDYFIGKIKKLYKSLR